MVCSRSSRTKHDVTICIRREHHVQKLREILIVCGIVLRLENVEQTPSLKTIAELLDSLSTNAINAQQIVLCLADQIPYCLNAYLAEFIRPTL